MIHCYAHMMTDWHNDVAYFIRNDAMFAKNISEATSLGKAVIISETTSFAVRQTSLKKVLHFREVLFSGSPCWT